MRVAVIGSGISGLVSAWLLSRRHEVHLLERRSRLGGHTHTHRISTPDGGQLAVDSGFIVYNEPTYPLFTQLLDELDVDTEPSDMSWSLRCDRHDLEYAGSPRGIVAQPANLADPDYLRLVRDIIRFNRLGRRLLDAGWDRQMTIGRFLPAARFSDSFAEHYLKPMAAAIWSTGTGTIESFPVRTLLTFFDNHGLLGLTTHHPWRTITGGASSYIPPLVEPFGDRVHVAAEVRTVLRTDDTVAVHLGDGSVARFDALVVATHADQALSLLADATPDEKELLGEWEYSHNRAYLHTDATLLPRRRAARASWNYHLEDCRTGADRVSLSYDMNRLQNLDTREEVLVTLNPSRSPDPELVHAEMTYEHPTYTEQSVATQTRLDELNGHKRTFFAGAYHRYGFHEDGVWSAVRVAQHLGVDWPHCE